MDNKNIIDYDYLFELEVARHERTERRLIWCWIITVIIAIIAVVIVDNNWRTFISESDITSYSYDQSGEGVNIVGDSNGVDTNGATREDKKNQTFKQIKGKKKNHDQTENKTLRGSRTNRRYQCVDGLSNTTIGKVIDEWVQGTVNRQIMKDRHIDKMCVEPLAEKYQLSVTTVKKVLNRYDPIYYMRVEEEIKKAKVAESEYLSSARYVTVI